MSRTTTTPPGLVPSTRSNAAKSASPENAPIWLRVGLPVTLALLAASLNVAAVNRKLQPTAVLAVTQDLPLGTRLRPEHLEYVQVAGNCDVSRFVSEDNLRRSVGLESHQQSIADILAARPRILSHGMLSGELLTHSSLGGVERPRKDEELLHVPCSIIQGSGGDLVPGQIIYLLAHHKISHDAIAETTEIGPFRVSFRDLSEESTKPRRDRDGTLPLVYRLTSSGKPCRSARILRSAVLNTNDYSLAIIERPFTNPDRTSP